MPSLPATLFYDEDASRQWRGDLLKQVQIYPTPTMEEVAKELAFLRVTLRNAVPVKPCWHGQPARAIRLPGHFGSWSDHDSPLALA